MDFAGSVLSGGGSTPLPEASATDWVNMINEYQKGSLASRLGIPMIYGIDAVHGHNNVYNATIFPHNIGLGATRQVFLLLCLHQKKKEGKYEFSTPLFYTYFCCSLIFFASYFLCIQRPWPGSKDWCRYCSWSQSYWHSLCLCSVHCGNDIEVFLCSLHWLYPKHNCQKPSL